MTDKQKSDISRAQFKKSLIDRVVIKIDYPNSIVDISDIVVKIRDHLKELGFSKFKKLRGSHGEISLSFDPNKEPDINYSSNDFDNYEFVHDNGKYKININENELAFVGQLNQEVIHFDDYGDLIYKIAADIKEKNSDYLPIKRIGLRKINTLLLDDSDAESVDEYFEESIFPKPSINGFKNNLVKGKYIDNYIKDRANVNYIRFTDKGVAIEHNQEVNKKRYIVDIDAYMIESENDLSMINESNGNIFKENLKEVFISLNHVCYEFFISSCRIDFLNQLITD